MANKLNYEEVVITPEMAKEIFDKQKNPNNRNLNRANVLMFARDMKAGKWSLDGEPLIFDWNGQIHDGHHRISAVIEAGVPVEFSVIRNVNPDTFPAIDSGRGRTPADSFKIASIENYSNVASIVRKFCFLSNGLVGFNTDKAGGNNPNDKKMSTAELLDIYEQHPVVFQEFCCYAQCLRCAYRFYTISELGGLMCYLHMNLGYEKEIIYRFFNILFQYKTEEEYQLCKEVRETIIKASLSGYRLSGVYKQSILATAWNNFAKGNNKRKKLNVPPTINKPIPFE